MIAVVRKESTRQDDTGNPEADFDSLTDVHLFPDFKEAEDWIEEDQAQFHQHKTDDDTIEYHTMKPTLHDVGV